MIGLYKTGGVHLVREQIEMCLPSAETSYDISDEGLVVWPGPGYETEVAYDLTARLRIEPRLIGGGSEANLPPLAPTQLLLRELPVRWQEWVRVWEACEHVEPGNGKPGDLAPNMCVLRT